jgi:hypothetical protein
MIFILFVDMKSLGEWYVVDVRSVMLPPSGSKDGLVVGE